MRKEDIAELKKEYLDFYADCPKQSLAAQYIMRSSECITDWKAADPEFASMILQAEANFARKELRKTGAEWKLARILGKHFKEPDQNINVNLNTDGYSDEELKAIVNSVLS